MVRREIRNYLLGILNVQRCNKKHSESPENFPLLPLANTAKKYMYAGLLEGGSSGNNRKKTRRNRNRSKYSRKKYNRKKSKRSKNIKKSIRHTVKKMIQS